MSDQVRAAVLAAGGRHGGRGGPGGAGGAAWPPPPPALSAAAGQPRPGASGVAVARRAPGGTFPHGSVCVRMDADLGHVWAPLPVHFDPFSLFPRGVSRGARSGSRRGYSGAGAASGRSGIAAGAAPALETREGSEG